MIHVYFLAYYFSTPDGKGGFGRTEAYLSEPINAMSDIAMLESQLNQTDPPNDHAITNYQLMRLEAQQPGTGPERWPVYDQGGAPT